MEGPGREPPDVVLGSVRQRSARKLPFTNPLFDHSVGAQKHFLRNRESK